ncbi:MAG: bifunctional 4'-phosphopantothenoylcysteine decarboxylase/phosphopantothenoylcysteine synthetase, partial [Calditrichaeota bacterium]
MFSGKKILVGVCGGIAAYKVCELVRDLKRQHADVRVMMTPDAARFVTPVTFQALSGNPVAVDLFAASRDEIEHIYLGRWADAIVIAPATANTLAKLAHGMADNVVTSTVLAARVPVVLAPAMNTAMWETPATVENMEKLKARFFAVVEPEYGELASEIE